MVFFWVAYEGSVLLEEGVEDSDNGGPEGAENEDAGFPAPESITDSSKNPMRSMIRDDRFET